MSNQISRTRTLRALEWDKLITHLSKQAHTASAKSRCLALLPDNEFVVAQMLLAETNEAASLIETKSGFNFESLPDISSTLARLKTGADLSGLELSQVKQTLVAARLTKSSLSLLERQSFPQLTKFIDSLNSLDTLVQEIDAAFEDNGEIKYSASPLLRSLKDQVHSLDNQIRDELTKIIHSSAQSKALMEPIYTQRNGRYVLPVSASMRGTIDGIVHDSSASGLTVYVEPISIVELENKLRLKQAEVEREIARIIAELSKKAHEKQDEIESSFTTLIELDLIMARARFGLSYKGSCPAFEKTGVLKFVQARHPLLVLKANASDTSVIPNDIVLSESEQSLIITGPNTGGKTVYLKTAGLLSLMIKCGLMLPVASGSQATFFADVFADIGDEQSIEQNLSTFSSHMTNIVDIINQAGPNNLVLLDEIGAGTDPREGAALARAILEHLHAQGTATIASTHYGELKTLAYGQSGFINASLEFDEATLSPTYRLLIGVPGASKATTMAKRLGLDVRVIHKAEEYLAASEHDLQKTIEQLESKLASLAQLEAEAKQAKTQAQEKDQLAERKLQEVEAQKEKLKTGFQRQLEDEFQLAKENLRKIIADLQSQPSSQKAQKTQQQLEEIRKDLKWEKPNQKAPDQIQVGQRVKIVSLNQIGTVIDPGSAGSTGKDAQVTVKVGNFQIKVQPADLIITEAQPSIQQRQSRKQDLKKDRTYKSISSESNQVNVFVQTQANTLDLRGERVLEAIDRLERFLDACTIGHISPLMVIHGHGTGAVKSAVRDYLSGSSYVDSFRPGETYEGGDGVTVVELI